MCQICRLLTLLLYVSNLSSASSFKNSPTLMLQCKPNRSKSDRMNSVPPKMSELRDLFPLISGDLQLENVDHKKLNPSIHKLFSEITQKYFEIRNTSSSQLPETDCSTLLLEVDLAKSYVWEQLHTGQWKDVDPEWRKLYSYLSLFKAFLCLELGKEGSSGLVNAIAACDMGLIMGQPILDGLLSNIADSLNEKLWELSENKRSFQKNQMEQEDSIESYPQLNKKCLIETVHIPSIETFLLDIMDKKPVVITGNISINMLQDVN